MIGLFKTDFYIAFRCITEVTKQISRKRKRPDDLFRKIIN